LFVYAGETCLKNGLRDLRRSFAKTAKRLSA
jgi:hypothetical protein